MTNIKGRYEFGYHTILLSIKKDRDMGPKYAREMLKNKVRYTGIVPISWIDNFDGKIHELTLEGISEGSIKPKKGGEKFDSMKDLEHSLKAIYKKYHVKKSRL